MERTFWNLSLNTDSGLTQGDVGDIEVGATTTVPLTIEPSSVMSLNLQLTNTDKLDVFSIVSSAYDGSVEITSDGSTYKLTGPLLLFGKLIKRFSADLSTLSIENKHVEVAVDLKLFIGRTLI